MTNHYGWDTYGWRTLLPISRSAGSEGREGASQSATASTSAIGTARTAAQFGCPSMTQCASMSDDWEADLEKVCDSYERRWLVHEAKVDLHDGRACEICGTPARHPGRPLPPMRDPDRHKA